MWCHLVTLVRTWNSETTWESHQNEMRSWTTNDNNQTWYKIGVWVQQDERERLDGRWSQWTVRKLPRWSVKSMSGQKIKKWSPCLSGQKIFVFPVCLKLVPDGLMCNFETSIPRELWSFEYLPRYPLIHQSKSTRVFTSETTPVRCYMMVQ